MNVTGQSVVTPRSKTMTGTSLLHAASTAGVSVLVVFGAMMIASHLPPDVSDSMSEICLSSFASASTTVNFAMSLSLSAAAFMVFRPFWRHGLSDAAFEKQTFQPELFLDLYFAVSTISGSIICSHGVDASPSGVTDRCASCLSMSAWLKNSALFSPVFDSVAVSVAAGVDAV